MKRSLLAASCLLIVMTSTYADGFQFQEPETLLRHTPGKELVPIAASPPIDGGTTSERARMRIAIDRFEAAGLTLPPLRIVFRDPSHDDCHGALGYFAAYEDVWRIAICSPVDSVYEHELAHAWERSNVTDAQRDHFTALRGLPTWSDRRHDWNQRGIEWAAIVIQQGLAGLPLPPALSDEVVVRLKGYEVLTGRVAPRLVEWMAKREVSCASRPTILSLRVADASDRICGPWWSAEDKLHAQ